MRLIDKLKLLSTASIAAFALMASSALGVEVTDEERNTHCGPCNVVVAGEWQLVVHSGGIEQTVTNCYVILSGETHEDGSGHFTNVGLTGGSACVMMECRSPSPSGRDDEWPLQFDDGTIIYELCLYNSHLQKTYCDVEGTFATEPSENHNYLLELDSLCPSGVEIVSVGASAFELADHEGAPGPPYTWDAIEILP
jgi:hypothetical protein